MNLIECNHCEKKYALKLEKIPQTPKKWKCSNCRGVSSFPFYSEKEQEFLMNVAAACQNCKKEYEIASNKFIAATMKVICFKCKSKFAVFFPNFQNLQKLNQKLSTYLSGNQEKQSEIFSGDKAKFESLLKEVIPKKTEKSTLEKNVEIEANPKKQQEKIFTTENSEQNSHQDTNKLENFNTWENKIKEQKGVIPQNLRSHLFLSGGKEEKLDISLPSLPIANKKEKIPSKNIGVGFLLFTLFFLVVIVYIYLVKFL